MPRNREICPKSRRSSPRNKKIRQNRDALCREIGKSSKIAARFAAKSENQAQIATRVREIRFFVNSNVNINVDESVQIRNRTHQISAKIETRQNGDALFREIGKSAKIATHFAAKSENYAKSRRGLPRKQKSGKIATDFAAKLGNQANCDSLCRKIGKSGEIATAHLAHITDSKDNSVKSWACGNLHGFRQRGYPFVCVCVKIYVWRMTHFTDSKQNGRWRGSPELK